MKNRSIRHHISLIQEAIDEWLRPDNTDLKKAVVQTIEEKLFEGDDVRFQIKWLKKSLRKEVLKQWVSKHRDDIAASPKNVVCLHAGNIPLVGLQDLLAVLLTGHRYVGKVSRKDPYLMPSFFKVLAEKKLIDVGDWAIDIQNLPKEKADAVLFAGSTQSVEKVFNTLEELNIADRSVPALIRTAHFSIAHIEDFESETMRMLIEAAMRYGGNGCRSVAMVVAPFSFRSKACNITDFAEEYLIRLIEPSKEDPLLYHRYAYNKAVGIHQIWLERFLIEETDAEPEIPGLIHWVVGDRETTSQLAERFGEGLQSVYVTDPEVEIKGVKTEPLANAQRPPIDWKPDGVDAIQWLTKYV